MALQYYPSARQSANCLKRKHIDSGNISNDMFKFRASSILTNMDWVDHVVADVSTRAPATIHPKPTPGDQKLNATSLQDFFINMMKSRGYSGLTHCTLTCGYNNKPSVSHVCDYYEKCDISCTYLTRMPLSNVSNSNTRYRATESLLPRPSVLPTCCKSERSSKPD